MKLKRICALALCAFLAMPCTQADAATVTNGSTTSTKISKSVDYTNRDGGYTKAEEKEYNEIKTTIITTKEEVTDPAPDPVTHEVIGMADIVFAIDSTGSMYPYINNVQNNVEAFASYLEEKGVPARLAVMEYRDITCDGEESTKIHMVDGTTWHKTTEELKKTLDIVKRVNGGGDEPETLVDALGFVANDAMLFRESAHKFVIVLTDATYKEDNRHGYTMDSVIEALEKKNIHTSVITEEGHYDVYKKLVGERGMMADIRSENFSDELKKLADALVETVTIEPDPGKHIVESVKVTSKGDSAVKVGNSITLQATVLPEDATDKTVVWVVNKEGIVDLDVSENTRTCTVTGKAKGSVVITAATMDGGFTGEYNVKVIGGSASSESDTDEDDGLRAGQITKDDLKVTPARKNIAQGSKFSIKVSIVDSSDLSADELEEMLEDNIDSIVFRSTKTSVASVNKSTGTVTALRKGKAVIKTTVNLKNGQTKTFKTSVTVK